MSRPSAIGGYEDWPAYLRSAPLLDGDAHTARLARLLGVPAPRPLDVGAARVVRTWEDDGVVGTELEWQTGFGPPTRAWRLAPADASPDTLLPGVLALHCHAGVKWVGADRLVRTPWSTPEAERVRASSYEGRSVASDLARRGLVVLAHDTFAWGSRRVTFDPPPWRTRDTLDLHDEVWAARSHVPTEAERYDAAAAQHESTLAKAAGLLGTSFAGTVAHDDLAALGVLSSMPDVDADRLGVVGFSGGGGRAAVLAHLDPRVRASVVVCMMTTFDSLVPAYLDAHSWLLQTPGLAGELDWPDVAAARSAHHQLVISAEDDALFPRDGMHEADARLAELFAAGPGSHTGVFVPGPHRFDAAMQATAGEFLTAHLGTNAVLWVDAGTTRSRRPES